MIPTVTSLVYLITSDYGKAFFVFIFLSMFSDTGFDLIESIQQDRYWQMWKKIQSRPVEIVRSLI